MGTGTAQAGAKGANERDKQGARALAHRAGVREMREELRQTVTGFFRGLGLPDHDTLTDDDRRRLVTLADLVTMARSPVERDRVKRDIELVPDPEAPARFAIMLAGPLEGLRVIGPSTTSTPGSWSTRPRSTRCRHSGVAPSPS